MFQRVSFGFWVLLGLLISVWVLSIVATGAGFNVASFEWDFTNSGAFGDSFGPISAVMASLAAAAAFETLHDSRVSARRTELREQKREREDDIRRFENTYFNLLRSFENLVEQTDIERGQERHVKRGRDCHAYMFRVIQTRAKNPGGNYEEAFNYVFEKYINDLAHYFRFFFNLVSFVDSSKAPNKYFYVRMLRAMLSEAELSLLALNALFHPEGKIHLRRMIEKYAFLNNISEEVIASLDLRGKFHASAFQRAGDPPEEAQPQVP